jgi:Magnesium chelatase, subunit ChlI
MLDLELSIKPLELLKDVVPRLAHVVVLWNAANPANASGWDAAQAAARALGLRLHSQDVRGPQNPEGALAFTAQAHPDALLGMHRQHIDVGLIGGGQVPLSGEVSLAHHGMLLLDELPEFCRHVLEVLRQPFEEGLVSMQSPEHPQCQ